MEISYGWLLTYLRPIIRLDRARIIAMIYGVDNWESGFGPRGTYALGGLILFIALDIARDTWHLI